MKILELFCGYGTASFALKRLKIPYELVGYSDIDKYANQCFKQNHCPEDTENKLRLGDVTKVDEKSLPDFDLLTGGFPCQSFSLAGKGLGVRDTRGTLFHDIIRIAEHKKPKYLFLENVKGLTTLTHKDTYETIMAELERIGYVVYSKILNTKDYGIPQNRERVWFVCFRMDVWKENTNFKWPKPEQLKILLKDILEDNPDSKFNLKDKSLQNYNREFGTKGKIMTGEQESPALTSAMGTGGGNVPGVDPKYYLSEKAIERILVRSINGRLDTKIAKCITAGDNYKGGRQANIIKIADFRNDEGLRIRENNLSPCLNASNNSEKEPSRMPPLVLDLYNNKVKKDICITLTEPHHNNLRVLQLNNATSKGYLEAEPGDGIRLDQPDSKTRRGRVQKQISPTLDTSDQKGVVTNNLTIRKLTPIECFRLQGFLNDEVNLDDLSDTQKYKMAGNGQSVNVVEKIFIQMFQNGLNLAHSNQK